MLETIKLWDSTLFLFLNGIHAPLFDGIMWAISNKYTWLPLYFSVIFMVIKYWKKESGWIILALIMCIVIADQVSSGLIKQWVERPRPSHAVDLSGLVHLVNGYTGGRFGFVSSHAANSVGFALLSSLLFRHKTYTISIFGWAVLTAYSRIYLGVHYPLDILGGTVVGLGAAYTCYFIIKKLRPSLLGNQDNETSAVNKPTTLIPLWVLILSYIGIIIYSIAIL